MKIPKAVRRAADVIGGIAAAGFGLLAYMYLTLPDVRPLQTANPATSAFMELRAREARAAGHEPPSESELDPADLRALRDAVEDTRLTAPRAR